MSLKDKSDSKTYKRKRIDNEQYNFTSYDYTTGCHPILCLYKDQVGNQVDRDPEETNQFITSGENYMVAKMNIYAKAHITRCQSDTGVIASLALYKDFIFPYTSFDHKAHHQMIMLRLQPS